MSREILQVAKSKTYLSENKIGLQNAQVNSKNFPTRNQVDPEQVPPSEKTAGVFQNSESAGNQSWKYQAQHLFTQCKRYNK